MNLYVVAYVLDHQVNREATTCWVNWGAYAQIELLKI